MFFASFSENMKPSLVVIGGISERYWQRDDFDKPDLISNEVQVVNLFGAEDPPDPKHIGPLPEPRMKAGAVLDQNDIYIMGGTSKMEQRNVPNALNTLWKFDSETSKWHTKSPMNDKRINHFSLRLGTNIFAIGGWNPVVDGIVKTVEKYNILSDTWSYDTPLPYKLDYTSGCIVHGKGYLVGGRAENGTEGIRNSKDILRMSYDEHNNEITWEIKTQLPSEFGVRKVAVTTDGDVIYIMGGEGREQGNGFPYFVLCLFDVLRH